jgi:cell shape-determining protein MreC
MKQNYAIIILIILVLSLIFINPAVFWNFKRYLITFNNNLNSAQIINQENLILKSKLNEFSVLENFLPKIRFIEPAFIYSKYPFNLKNEVLINLGKDKTKINQAAVLINNSTSTNFILIGKILESYDNFSIVQTIFDSNFKLPVKIGSSFSNALLIGGPNPKLTLISRDSKIQEGDVVISADSNLPYGLILGSVGKIKEIENTLFSEAEILVPYDLNQINVLGIVK